MAETGTSSGSGTDSDRDPETPSPDDADLDSFDAWLSTDEARDHPDPLIRRAARPLQHDDSDTDAGTHTHTHTEAHTGDGAQGGRTAGATLVDDGPHQASTGDAQAESADTLALSATEPSADTSTTTPAVPRTTRSGRVQKWNRPRPPYDWRWYVGNLGKTLIAVGLLMFGFVAYQLWGTAIETAAAQNDLENEFEAMLADSGPIDVATPSSTAITVDDSVDDSVENSVDEGGTGDDEPTSTENVSADPASSEPSGDAVATAVPVVEQNIPALDGGDALARLEIPRIGLDDIVVAGVEIGDLKKGPGHFPNTPMPGQLGNSAIAGHRTTYGQPFFDVDQLQVGDPIRVTTLNGVFTYRVTGQQIVSPSDYGVVATSDPTRANLTLTSCHPKYTARERIVVSSELDTTESAPVGAPVLDYGRPDPVQATTEIPGDPDLQVETGSTAAPATRTTSPTLVDDAQGNATDDDITESDTTTGSATDGNVSQGSAIDELGTVAVNDEIADAFSDGWFSDSTANPQVGLWGLAVAAIAIGAYMLSRRLRRDWAGLAVGIVPFALALYFFFQNVNRLLPPNL